MAQTAVLLHAAARVEEARVFAGTSLREALPAEQEAEVRLSIASMFALSPDVRVDAGRQALALPELSPGLHARHLASLVHNLLVGGCYEKARANLPDARAAVSSSGDANAAFMLDLAEGGLEAVHGRFGRALELTEAAARSGSATHDYARERLTQEWRCEVMTMLDRLEESLELTADGIAAAQRDRQGWALRIVETWRGRQLLQSGRLHDAAAILEGQFSPEEEERHESILDAAGVVALGRVALQDVTDDTQLVRIALAVEDHELVESAVVAAERRAELNPEVRTIGATAAHARGLATGNHDDLARAVELFDESPRPLALASALEELGAAALKRGSTDEGTESLGRALTIYAEAGAAWDAGRVRSRLRAQGLRRRLVSADRPETRWAAMTDSELAVARLVAQGLTNREVAEQLFVSPHTVSTHLRHVFTKLDVNSRAELTRLAGDHDIRS